MKERIVWLMIMVMCLVGTGQAMNILLCSEAEKPVSHGGAAAGEHEDDSLVAWLESLGHTVNTDYMNRGYRDSNAGPPKGGTQLLADCEAADLIFISRSTTSGQVDGSGSEIAWNGVTTPLLLNGNSFIIRGAGVSSHRWGWATSGHDTSVSSTTDFDLTAGGSTTMFDWSPNSASPAGVGVFQGNVASLGVIKATFDGAGREVWVEFPAGTDFNAANGTTGYGVAGAERVFFGHWGYDSDGNGPTGGRGKWSDYITQEYKDTLAAVIISVGPDPNINPAPVVDAGPDQNWYTGGDPVQLAGSASDEGPWDGVSEGSPGGVDSLYWYQLSGPGTATFTPADTSGVLDPTVTFSNAGVYELMLQVSDGFKDSNDIVSIQVLAPQLVGHWKFDDDAQLDSSINSNDGVLNGDPNYTTDAAVGSHAIDLSDYLGLDAVDNHDPKLPYVYLGAATELDFNTHNWTVCGWVKTTQIATAGGDGQIGKGTIFGNGGDTGGGHRYALILSETSPNRAQLVVDADSNGGKFTVEDDGPDNDGLWHFILGQRVGGEIRIYRDGVLEGTNTGPPADFDLSGSSQYGSYIGVITDHDSTNPTIYKHLDGLVDDVRVYNYDLDEAAILGLAGMGELLVLVDAGPNQSAQLQPGELVTMAGSVVDNGIAGTLNIKWSTVSGPEDANAIFTDDTAPDSTVSFPVFGEYVLSLTVEDVTLGQFVYSEVMVDAISPTCAEVITADLVMAGDVAGGPAAVPGGGPDCYVDLRDIAFFAEQFLRCNNPQEPLCEDPWL